MASHLKEVYTKNNTPSITVDDRNPDTAMSNRGNHSSKIDEFLTKCETVRNHKAGLDSIDKQIENYGKYMR